ncbi:MAG: 16S rRNA (guanine(527)-N(7))-methyltransferase RsmG [Planctomycetaceae bacterium]
MPLSVASLEDLQAALQRHHVSVPDHVHQSLVDYCDLLWEWNEQINLTRHTDMDAFVSRDLIDTLQLSKHLAEGCSVLDVGSGGGVPGIPLAMLRPDLKIEMAESVAKKAKVLKTLARDLKLPVKVFADRAEKLVKSRSYDVLTIRAVAPIRKLLFWFRQYPDHFHQLLLIKGPRWVTEFEEAKAEGLANHVHIEKIDEYATPGHDNNSVILSVTFELT